MAYARSDRVLSGVLRPGYLRLDGRPRRSLRAWTKPRAWSRARSLTDAVGSVAVAFPRGRGPQAAMLGLYLSLWRHVAAGAAVRVGAGVDHPERDVDACCGT